MLLFIFGILVGYVFAKLALVNSDKSPSQDSNAIAVSIANQLEKLSEDDRFNHEREAYHELATALREERLPIPLHPPLNAKPPDLAIFENGTRLSAAYTKPEIITGSIPDIRRGEIHVAELLENVNTLLFAGAFLVIVSAGILISANFDVITNGIKVGLLALFAASFYSLGLPIYTKPKLKPAGSTFIGIGLVLTPLVGVAAQVLLLPAAARWPTFALTALVSFGLNLYTSRRLRQTYMQYLTIAMGLGVIQFSLLSMRAEFIYLMWALLISSIVMVIASRSSMEKMGFAAPLLVTAQIVVPISYIAAAAQTLILEQLGQLAVSSILAAIFYHLVGSLIVDKSERSLLQSLGLLLWPTATCLLLAEIIGLSSGFWLAAAIALACWSMIYSLLDLNFQKIHRLIDSNAWVQASVTSGIVALLFLFNRPGWLSAVLLLSVFQHFFHYVGRRNINSLILSLLALVLVPYISVFYAFSIDHNLAAVITTVLYAGLGWFLVTCDKGLLGGSFSARGKEALRASIVVSFVIAFFVPFAGTTGLQTVAWLGLAAMSFLLTRVYQNAHLSGYL